ncbi:protein SCO1/2 [Paenibacillus sp. UNCCL117]|uniref:SCO family protein n=1 Tax=unclassified Paenibacillus TaxID=185978 RepID=UPI000884235C|nr:MULTISPECIES: SCO family protein [unclassified Paenibacillus]SDD96826.1 protein SCO1/2 [Paenibacillus sp. cl123]SFW56312.1 protein SCO1/2 [Paenibacillus sp. UNCCL117]
MVAILKRHGFKAAVCVLLIALAYSVYSWVSQDGPPLPTLKQAPAFTLQNLDGTPTGLEQTDGKVRLVEFLFTSCPDICPMTTYNMVKLQNQLKQTGLWGDKVQFLSITFDPQRDTPEVFKRYGDKMGMDYTGWTLLTGTEKETAEVARSFGVLVQKMPDGSFVHTVTSLFLIDQQGKIRKVFPMGEEMNNEDVYKTIRQLAGSSS